MAMAASADGPAPPLGVCESMCPAEEVEERLRWDDFHPLERRHPGPAHVRLGVKDLAVKKFRRNIEAGDRAPRRLRTRQCLARTVEHLVALLDLRRGEEDVFGEGTGPSAASSSSGAISEADQLEWTHEFLWDRLRGVRTDLTIQRLLASPESIRIHEHCVRYHIVASYELVERKATVANPHGFDPALNREQLMKSLQTLLSIYAHSYAAGEGGDGGICSNEAEFRAYDLLLGLDAFKLTRMPGRVLRSKEVAFAVEAQECLRTGNWSRWFKLLRRATYLQACLLSGHVAGMRQRALRILCSKVFGPSARPFAIGDLSGALCWPERDVRRWAETAEPEAVTEDKAALLLAGHSSPLRECPLDTEEKRCEAISAKKEKQTFSQVIFARTT